MSTSSGSTTTTAPGMNARAAGISDSALSDLRDDALGFTPFVRTLAAFVRHKDTSTPLTISVEGRWGSGKSTFLNFLREQLEHEGEAVVVFDAWRHERSDSLLSDFALELIRQLRSAVSPRDRIFGSLRLWLARFAWYEATPAIILSVTYLAAFLTLSYAIIQVLLHAGNLRSNELENTLIRSGGIVAYAAAIALATKLAVRALGAPRFAALRQYAKGPLYSVESAFRERALRDIERVVEAWGFDRRIYVIIDDVDRCSPAGIAELVRALNIITSTHARNLVFFIGMDRPMVVASIASQMAPLVPFLNRFDNAHQADARERDRTIALANEYLDKFITVPFRVPALEAKDIYQLLQDFNPATTNGHFYRRLRHLDDRQQSNDSQEFRRAVEMLAFMFSGSPRMFKRFINLLRLSELLVGYLPPVTTERPDIVQLAKFTVMSLRWPELIEDLSSESGLLRDLEYLALGVKGIKIGDLANTWATNPALINLMKVDAEGKGSMATVSIPMLLWASRARLQPSDFFSETDPRVGRSATIIRRL